MPSRSRSAAVRKQVLRTGLAVDPKTQILRAANGVGRLGPGDVHDEHRDVDEPRKVDGPARRLALRDARMADRMILRRSVSPVEEPIGEPPDHVVVLGVHHGHRAFAPREREHVEHLVVVELEQVVGHVHLERGVAVLDERRKLLADNPGGGVGDDEVEGVVDDRLGARAAVVRLDHLAQRLPAVLRGERDDGGGAPERGGDRPGVEVVRAQDPGRRLLLDVAVTVDPAGQHELAGGVDLVVAFVEVEGQGRNCAVPDPHVGGVRVGRGCDGAAANDEIESVHREPPGRERKR